VCVCVLSTDLYTFDADATSAQATFHEVCDSYVRILTRLGLPFMQGAAAIFIVVFFVSVNCSLFQIYKM